MANLSAECRSRKINFDMYSFFVWLSDKYKPNHIYIFTGYLEKYANEYENNKTIGYQYIFKEAVYNKDEQKIKANCDVDIAIQGTFDATQNNLEKAILVTSDGDFASLVKFWQEHGVSTLVVSPASGRECSYLLRRITTVIFLSQIIDKFRSEKALNRD